MMARTAIYVLTAFATGTLAFEGISQYSQAQAPQAIPAQQVAQANINVEGQSLEGRVRPLGEPSEPQKKPARPVQHREPAAPAVTPASPPPAAATPAPATTAPIVTAPAPAPPAPAVAAPGAIAPAPTAPPSSATPAAIAPSDTPAIAKPPIPPIKADVDKKNLKRAAPALFAARQLPSIGRAAAIGYYPKGCLSGGVELAADGPAWQVMRLSRNRNWGHPSLIHFVEGFAERAAKATGWKGILVGDLAQPRGGPTPTGHRSHQTGLDVDVWFMPMPDRRMTRKEREELSASNLVASDWKHLNPKTWTPQHVAFIKTAAVMPNVERVLVNAAIKKELCRVAGKNNDWLSKVRPWYGHHDHIHVRLRCPSDSPGCKGQPPVPKSEGCGKELDFWFSDKVLRPVTKFKPRKPMTLAELPAACNTVLNAPAR